VDKEVMKVDKDCIAKIIAEVIEETLCSRDKLLVPVGVSARHVHLSREHLDLLFGSNYELTRKKELMGGDFAAEECVTLVGGKLTTLEKVRILGPVRKQSQIEVSGTDAVKLGVKAPVRESGDLQGSAPITIVGPKGAITLAEGCIIAQRHIHMPPEDAARFGINDRQIVSVSVSGERGGVLGNVLVRVGENYLFEMHIDTDEANALGIQCGSKLEIIR
jgi:putative phosphotransacetylase